MLVHHPVWCMDRNHQCVTYDWALAAMWPLLCENYAGFQSLPGSSTNFVHLFTKQWSATCQCILLTCWHQLMKSVCTPFVYRGTLCSPVAKTKSENACFLWQHSVHGTKYRQSWNFASRQQWSCADLKLFCLLHCIAENDNIWTVWGTLGELIGAQDVQM